jgi:hypothetical protein
VPPDPGDHRGRRNASGRLHRREDAGTARIVAARIVVVACRRLAGADAVRAASAFGRAGDADRQSLDVSARGAAASAERGAAAAAVPHR